MSELFSLLSSLFINDLSNCYYVRPLQFSCYVHQNWSFRDHLSHALPTERIFNLLRQSIHSEYLMRHWHYSVELVVDMVKVIIEWLEVSFRRFNQQLETSE